MRIKSLMIFLMAAGFLAVGLTTTAFAAKCENVRIKVKNERPQEIKVFRIKYHDTEAEKWRLMSFNTWRLAPSTREQKQRTLDAVKNQPVKMRVEWAFSKGGNKWSAKQWSAVSPKQKCSGGQTFFFKIK